jgi:hypothetical protein
VIISDANEYRGVLLYQTANRFANFSPEGRQRPMNVPSYQVGFGLQVGFRATAAAPRLGWAQGDCPPLLPTQADGRRAHMHPARGTGMLICQRHQLVPVASASGRPCGPATRSWPGCPVPMRRRAGPGRPQLGVARRSLGRSSVCQGCVQTRSPTRSRALNGKDPKPQGGCRPTYSSAHLRTFSLHPIPIPSPSPVQRVPLAQCASP